MRILKTLPVLVFFSLLFSENVLAQNAVNVNNLTGRANISIPVFNVKVGDISAPVALSYTAAGLKVEDYDYTYGLGWNLVAGGAVYREVRGFPDDVQYQGDAAWPWTYGWLYTQNTAPQTAQTFTIADDFSNTNCNDEVTNKNALVNYSYKDAEPDIFTASAPGLYCSFVFDAASGNPIRLIEHRNYKVEYTRPNFIIQSFTITNEAGIKYYFTQGNMVTHGIYAYPIGSTQEIDPNTLEVFKNDFMMYRTKSQSGGAFYHDMWMLTKIEDTKGNYINFGYAGYSKRNPTVKNKYEVKEMEIYKSDGVSGVNSYTKKKLYSVHKIKSEYRLESVVPVTIGADVIPVSYLSLNYSNDGGQYDEDKLSSITVPKEKFSFVPTYTRKFNVNQSTWYGYGRFFLRSVKFLRGNCSSTSEQFDFSYYNVNEATNTCYCTPVYNSVPVDTILNAQDYWGYYNGAYSNASKVPTIRVYADNAAVETYKLYQIPGYSNPNPETTISYQNTVNRNATANASDGSLKRIAYPLGGITELEYEPNTFFDKDVNGAVTGGGIRVKKITHNDGLNTNDVTTYSYNDPATSITTGRAISVPVFTIGFPHTNSYGTLFDKIKNSVYRTDYDLGAESKDILYGKVTVTKAGAGKSIFEYKTTGTYLSTAVTDWAETVNYNARTNVTSPGCPAFAPSFVRNDVLQYPFAPNPAFDFERGLPERVIHYNDAGTEVGREEYTYSRSHTTPLKIYGVKVDEMNNTAKAYAKYTINTRIDNYLVTKLSKVNNSTSPSASFFTSTTENFVYTPPASTAAYRLLTETRLQNSDGSTFINRFKYAPEYTTTGAGDDMDKAIHDLKAKNNLALIESYQSKLEAAVEKTISASVSTFKPHTVGVNSPATKYLPFEKYSFINQAGLTGFTWSSFNGSQVFVKNSNYTLPPVVIEKYNVNALPQLVTSNTRQPKTMISADAEELVTLEVQNARPENISFTNFEKDNASVSLPYSSAGSIASPGRFSNNCLSLTANAVLTRIVNNANTNKKIIISFWAKDASGAGEMYFAVTKNTTFPPSGLGPGYPSVNITTGNTWKYYQVVLDNRPVSNPSFYVGMASSVNLKIDDILIYPDNAGISANSYTDDAKGYNLLTAKTGLNGLGEGYEYDNPGRVWMVRNSLGEIKELRNSVGAWQSAPFFSINYILKPTINQSYTYSIEIPEYSATTCAPPKIIYKWNFGDGTPEVSTESGSLSTASSSTQHTYTVLGKYQITVTAYIPGMAPIVTQTPPVTNVAPNPLPIEVVSAPPPPPPTGGGGTPLICAAGITQYSGGVCTLTNCSGMTAICTETKFRLTGITGGSMSYVASVTWQYAATGPNATWYNWGGVQTQPVYQTVRPFHIAHTSTYMMRAKVQFTDGSIAYSNSITVTNDNY